MRLHNWCIDHNIQDETNISGPLSVVQPDRWAITPTFDKEGRPVEHLDILRTKETRGRMREIVGKTARRDELIEIVRDHCIQRPALRAGITRKRRKEAKASKMQKVATATKRAKKNTK